MKVWRILGKDFNLFSVLKFVSCRKLFPKYTDYSDYQSYVAQIKNDGHMKDIMGVGYPIALTNTSGTSGEPKNFPM
jgi:hypothetical protein